MEFDNLLLAGLVSVSSALLFWIAALIFGIVMLKRGGGRAEKFLIAGASIKIAGLFLSVMLPLTTIWFFIRTDTLNGIPWEIIFYQTFLSFVSMAGIICLVYAFWVKFKTREIVGSAREGR